MTLSPRHWLSIGLFCALAPLSMAASSAGAIALQQALDTPVTLTIERTGLAAALGRLASEGKLSLQIDPRCYDLLPYGAETRITINAQRIAIRNVLNESLTPLGLEMVVTGETALVRPTPALARMTRRVDWEELKLITDLRAKKVEKLTDNLQSDLRTALCRPELTIEVGDVDNELQQKALGLIRPKLPLSAASVLDLYAQSIGHIWLVDPATVRLLTPRVWTDRQLDRPTVLQYAATPLAQVVSDLEYRSGLRFVPEPGLYQSINAVNLSSNGGTIRQALDALSGATGLTYDVRPGEIFLRGPQKNANPTPRVDSIIGRIAVPLTEGMTFDVFVRESDLTPDLQTLRKTKIAAAVAALRASTTQPTTLPGEVPLPPIIPSTITTPIAPLTQP
jgi:hypothetical protein